MDKESNRYRSVSDAPLIGFVEDFRLSSLLQTNDLGQFSKKFVEHEVDFKTFLMLNESHLMDMGIDRIGSRVKLMNLITKSKDNQIQIQSKGNQKLRPGEILFEDLQFFECIGRGSFGSVFRGRWNDKVVAIKKLLNSCESEADLLSSVRHRHVIRCFGASLTPPNFCLVMEYAERSLRQAIYDPATIMTPHVVADWALQIAEGMNYLHFEAPDLIIHRDLKPANILIMHDGVLKVSDFGLARIRLTSAADQMSAVGTFEYMAPEMIRNEVYSEKVDVYSYGVLLWEMLTRSIPYNGLPPLSVAFGVGSGTLRLPFPSGCPVTISAIISRCIERAPTKRCSFKDILSSLRLLKSSDFISHTEFEKLQKNWQEELGEAFEALKKEIEAIKRKQVELTVAELSLEERERKLKERERNLATDVSFAFACCQTFKKFTEDIIGIGISVSRNYTNQVTQLEFIPEYLSATAFFDLEITHSLNRELHYQNFLPLYICQEHGEKSAYLMERAFLSIFTGIPQTKLPPSDSSSKLDVSLSTLSSPNLTQTSSTISLNVMSGSNSSVQSASLSSSSGPRIRTYSQPLFPTGKRRSSGKLEQKVKSYSKRSFSDLSNYTFHPTMALNILCQLINELLVNAVNQKFHPFKALEMYCAFHRIMLYFAEKYPSIISACDKHINDFISSEKERSEAEFPNIGEFMVYFVLSTIPWSSAVTLVVDEVLQRCWKWILKANPDLGSMKIPRNGQPIEFSVSMDIFLSKAFNGSLHAMKVIMLHVYLLQNIAYYENMNKHQIAKQYDDLYGRPTPKMKEQAEIAFKEIFSVSTFKEYFVRVGFTSKSFSNSEVSLLLRRNAAKAYERKYFVSPSTPIDDYVFVL